MISYGRCSQIVFWVGMESHESPSVDEHSIIRERSQDSVGTELGWVDGNAEGTTDGSKDGKCDGIEVGSLDSSLVVIIIIIINSG